MAVQDEENAFLFGTSKDGRREIGRQNIRLMNFDRSPLITRTCLTVQLKGGRKLLRRATTLILTDNGVHR